MTVTQARTAIRASTNHDADTQVTDAQLDVKIDQEFQRLRRALGAYVPALFESTSAPTITAGNNTIAKPATFERVRRLERLISGALYYPVPVVDMLNANQETQLVFYEQGSNLVLMPISRAEGTYRLTFVTKPAAGYTTFDVPEGCEDVIIERVAAWVRQRHDEDPGYHLRAAAEMWKEQRSVLLRRYGLHPSVALVSAR